MILNSYFDSEGAIDLGKLKACVPAVFAERPAEGVSARYGFINTRDVIDYMTEDGYVLTGARGGIRNRSREFGSHELRFRPKDTEVKLNEVFPEIVFTNSHDAGSAALFRFGLWRKVCSNGLVVSDSVAEFCRINHIGDQRNNVRLASNTVLAQMPKVIDSIDTWRKRILTGVEIQEFGERAMELRTPGRKGIGITDARRDQDKGSDLWSVFNRVQENLVGGGGASAYTPKGKLRKIAPLRGAKSSISLNQSLWELAEEFLPA